MEWINSSGLWIILGANIILPQPALSAWMFVLKTNL